MPRFISIFKAKRRLAQAKKIKRSIPHTMNKFEKHRKDPNKVHQEGKENSVKAEATDIISFTFFLVAAKPEEEIPDLNHYERLIALENPVKQAFLLEADVLATPEALQAVEDFANAYSLDIVNKKNRERWVSLRGTVENVENALDISIRKFYLQGNPYYFHKGEVAVPKALNGLVEAVTGINQEPIKCEKIFPDEKKLKEAQLKGLAVMPQDYAKLYNFPENLDGTGQCIGLISLGGGYKDTCLESYFEKINIPLPGISWVSVDEAQNDPMQNLFYDYEVYMDIEIAAALAPGAKIVMYFAPNTAAGVIKAIKKAVYDSENNPGIISMSWGCLENVFSTIEKRALNHVLMEAAAKNVTVIVSSGDHGSSGTNSPDGLNVQIPAANPYVLAVGGTEVHAQGGAILDEKVWEQTLSLAGKTATAASGGGFSSFWPIPRYQLDNIIREDYKQTTRGLPDVAANASTYPGIYLHVHESEQISMGTSAAAPLWAALIARINQYLNSLGLPNAGFLNPYLYQREISPAFNQITEGSNGAYEADQGWDPCTGLGTPNGQVLMKKIEWMQKKSRRYA